MSKTTGPIKVDSPNLKVEGTITAELKDGSHFTYRIKKFRPDVKEGRENPRLMVELLVGPDNSNNYKGFAFVGLSVHKIVNLWTKVKGTVFDDHAMRLEGSTDDVAGWLQAGKCRCCGRKLTTPESITAGIGPVCGGRA